MPANVPRVDSEFRALIPPLTPEERTGLEADIVRDGRATVPLIVWGDVLLDGHNRLEICQAHGLPYDTKQAPGWITDARDARIWIRTTSLNRRNLDVLTRIELASGNEEDIAAKNAEKRAATLKQNKPAKGQTTIPAARLVAPEGEPVRGKSSPGLAASVEKNSSQRSPQTRDTAAAQAGVSHPTYTAGKIVIAKAEPELRAAVKRGDIAVSTAAKIADLPKAKQREIAAAGPRAAREAARAEQAQRTETRRQERVEKLVKIANGDRPLDTVARRYPVVYADPPWRYEHAESESRAIENQYPTMALDEICALPLATITTPDAILFMWVTSPKLEEGMRVVREWGFTYRTCAVWDKEKIGMGYYFRQAHELLLVATKGNMPTPPPAARPSSVLRAERGEHSDKPDEMRDAIERMYPELPRVELFSRAPQKGWGVWGNQST